MIRISLDSQDFYTLISGEVVKKGEVEIILKDIGFAVMNGALEKAVESPSGDSNTV